MSASRFSGHNGLARRRLGVIHLVFFAVAASAPLTVLGGGVTTAFLVTGNIGTPVAFIVLAVALALFAVGYAAMSRYVSHAGAFYSYLANGLSRTVGVAGAFVALAAYSAINFALYGLLGAVFSDFLIGRFGVTVPWWLLAFAAIALVGQLGVLRVDLNATVLAVLLILECAVVAAFDALALTHPADGAVSLAGLNPANFFVPGFGAVLALGVACFTGFESTAVYSEEVVDPRRTVARATYLTVAFTGGLYALSAWALSVLHGPDRLVQVLAEQGPGAVLVPLATHIGAVAAVLAHLLFITSIFAALLSLHNGVARYLFALGRERVLPGFLGRTGIRSAAPVAGSLTQSVLSFVVVLVFVAAGRDPIVDLFTWFSGLAAVGIVLLMTATSIAVVLFFRRRPGEESAWRAAVAPSLAAILLATALFFLVYHFDALLDPANPDYLQWLLPGLVAVPVLLGTAWGARLRSSRPDIYAGIGRGAVEPVIDTDPAYASVAG